MTGPDTDPSSLRRLSRGSLRLRIAAAAAVVTLAVLFTARLASASFDEAPVPLGEVVSLDGIVSGTIHLSGGPPGYLQRRHRVQSNDSNLAVNFAAGGSLVLCPHSHLQILAANQHAGVMLAFEDGGSQQPFQAHANDLVMTPDWRVQMTGNLASDDFGTLQLSTTRHGELCLSSNAREGQFFRISELAGDSAYEITGQSSIRIAGGHIEDVPAGCSCESPAGDRSPTPPDEPTATPVVNVIPARPAAQIADATGTAPARPSPAAAPQSSTALSPIPRSKDVPHPVPAKLKSRRPQDVAGYVRSFVWLMFGR